MCRSVGSGDRAPCRVDAYTSVCGARRWFGLLFTEVRTVDASTQCQLCREACEQELRMLSGDEEIFIVLVDVTDDTCARTG